MEFGFGFLLFLGLITGVIGMLLGMFVEKALAGFWLGAFLGPIGWIIVFLLPREPIEERNSSHHQAPSNNLASPLSVERDLNSDAYKLYLGKKYEIQRNDLFQKFECKEKLFESLDEALAFANELEKEEREKEPSKKPFSKQVLLEIRKDLNKRNINLWVEHDKNNERIYVLRDEEGVKSFTWDQLILTFGNRK